MSISYNLASSNSRRGVLTILPSDLEKVLASIPIVLQWRRAAEEAWVKPVELTAKQQSDAFFHRFYPSNNIFYCRAKLLSCSGCCGCSTGRERELSLAPAGASGKPTQPHMSGTIGKVLNKATNWVRNPVISLIAPFFNCALRWLTYTLFSARKLELSNFLFEVDSFASEASYLRKTKQKSISR